MEEVITDSQVPFLRNENLTESTAQKVRIKYKINVVNDAIQSESPSPYADENTSPTPVLNLNNRIAITPIPAGNGSLHSITNFTPSQVDGSTTQVIVLNDPTGLTNPIPKGANTDQVSFYNGTLIDSYGTEYHIVNITNTSVTTANDAISILIDKEFGQPDPQIVNGVTYYLVKRDLYYGDDSGNLLGKLYNPFAKVVWDSTSGIVHATKISDLRISIDDATDFQEDTNSKFDYRATGGTPTSFDPSTNLASWGATFTIINPHGPNMTIPSSSTALIDGGSLAYVVNPAGGNLALGTISLSVTSTGSTINVSSVNLSSVRLGNTLLVNTSQVVAITAVDNVNKTLSVSPAVSSTGTGVIYLDSFAPATAPNDTESYILAVRNGSTVLFAQTLNVAPSVDVNSILTAIVMTPTIQPWEVIPTPFTDSGFYSTSASLSGFWRRVGDTMEVNVKITYTGTPLSGSAKITVPFGLQIDSTKLHPNSNGKAKVGSGMYQSILGGSAELTAENFSTTQIEIFALRTQSLSNPTNLIPISIAGTVPFAIDDMDSLEITLKLPILGWNVNDTPTREVLINSSGNVLTV